MKILVIEGCNYIDYPLGGQMNFMRDMRKVFGNDLALVGITTEKETPVGKWCKKIIDGVEFDYFSTSYHEKSNKRPIIPSRITGFINTKKYMKRILSIEFDYILLQAPEVFFALPKDVLDRTLMRMPGVGNPLSISRYSYGKFFAKIYDNYFSKRASKLSKILATANEEAIQDFLKRGKDRVKRENIIIFPTRYNEKFYNVLDRNETRKAIGIKENSIVFTTVGRLNWFKGWKLMLDAFDIVCKEVPDSHLYFIGDGEEKSKIIAYAVEKGLSDNVTMLGSQGPTEIAKYINASNAFIMGSYKEGWSTTLVEACACGVPCVVTDFSSAKEMVENGVNGYVIKNRDEADFADKMKKVLSLDRNAVVEYDKKYANLAISRMKDEITAVFKQM